MIELLISLMLLSLVLTLLYNAFGQISTHALLLRDRLNEQQELRLLLRMVSDDLRSAQWLERYWAKGIGFQTGIIADTVFEEGGDFTRIRFHAAQPSRFYRRVPPEQDPRLHEVAYEVRRSEDNKTLELVRREDFFIDNDMGEGGISVVLADRVDAFLVEFLPPGADPTAIQPSWKPRWDSPNAAKNARMPLAIRLTLGRLDPSGASLRETVEFNLPISLKL